MQPSTTKIAYEVVACCLRHVVCLTPLDVVRLGATCKPLAQLCHKELNAAEAAADELLWLASQTTQLSSFEDDLVCLQLQRSNAAEEYAREDLCLHLSRSLAQQLQSAVHNIGPLVLAVLISTPNVPKKSAMALVAAGVPVTYTQLLGAAYSNVQGFEVWVMACERLGLSSGLPALAKRFCVCECRSYCCRGHRSRARSLDKVNATGTGTGIGTL